MTRRNNHCEVCTYTYLVPSVVIFSYCGFCSFYFYFCLLLLYFSLIYYCGSCVVIHHVSCVHCLLSSRDSVDFPIVGVIKECLIFSNNKLESLRSCADLWHCSAPPLTATWIDLACRFGTHHKLTCEARGTWMYSNWEDNLHLRMQLAQPIDKLKLLNSLGPDVVCMHQPFKNI